jgi:hypothetical protein
MERSQNQELARRINHAFMLLKKGMPHAQITEKLSQKFATSKVQAYRYLQQAKEIETRVPIPESSVVFTVKLPPGLISQIKKYASAREMSISKTVGMALEDFLASNRNGTKKEAS